LAGPGGGAAQPANAASAKTMASLFMADLLMFIL
jgi:hypothetical protein